jgi:hypothetical protein
VLLASAIATLVAMAPPNADPRGLALIERVRTTWASVRTLTYRFRKEERLQNGDMVVEEVRVKLRRPPGEYYIAALKPHVGQEVIYPAPKDRTKLIAHPGSFPDVTLTLAVNGSLATKRQHHLVTHSGFDYLLKVIGEGLRSAEAAPAGESLEYGGASTLEGRAVERVIMHGGSRPAGRVRAKDDEPLLDFAKRVGCDAYLVVYANPGLEGLSDELDDAEYVVPAYYGKRTEVLVDTEYGLPLQVAVWDASDRLYERLTYFEMQVNPQLSDLDFDPENPAYNF